MIGEIDKLLSRYEQGRLSRRGLLSALATMAAAGQAAPASAPFKPMSINHVTLSVRGLERSRTFYQSVLDARVIGRAPREVDLDVGGGFIALMDLQRPPGIDHFCVGIEDYDASRVADAISSSGWKPRVVTEAIGVKFKEPQVYVPDPDGIRLQLSSAGYRGEMPPPA